MTPSFYRIEPPGEGKYSVLCVGFDDLGPQVGINENRLAFDGNALPYVPIKTYPERLQPPEAIVNKIIMHRCATVEEAIVMARSYDWGTIYSGKFARQYLLADATGDACVLGFGADGEWGVTRKPKGDGIIVSTRTPRPGGFPRSPSNRSAGIPPVRGAGLSEKSGPVAPDDLDRLSRRAEDDLSCCRTRDQQAFPGD